MTLGNLLRSIVQAGRSVDSVIQTHATQKIGKRKATVERKPLKQLSAVCYIFKGLEIEVKLIYGCNILYIKSKKVQSSITTFNIHVWKHSKWKL